MTFIVGMFFVARKYKARSSNYSSAYAPLSTLYESIQPENEFENNGNNHKEPEPFYNARIDPLCGIPPIAYSTRSIQSSTTPLNYSSSYQQQQQQQQVNSSYDSSLSTTSSPSNVNNTKKEIFLPMGGRTLSSYVYENIQTNENMVSNIPTTTSSYQGGSEKPFYGRKVRNQGKNYN